MHKQIKQYLHLKISVTPVFKSNNSEEKKVYSPWQSYQNYACQPYFVFTHMSSPSDATTAMVTHLCLFIFHDIYKPQENIL